MWPSAMRAAVSTMRSSGCSPSRIASHAATAITARAMSPAPASTWRASATAASTSSSETAVTSTPPLGSVDVTAR